MSNPEKMRPPYVNQRMAPAVAKILEKNGYYCLYLSAGWYHTNFPEIDRDPVTLDTGDILYEPAGGEVKIWSL